MDLVQLPLCVHEAGGDATEGEADAGRIKEGRFRVQVALQPVVELLHLPKEARLLPYLIREAISDVISEVISEVNSEVIREAIREVIGGHPGGHRRSSEATHPRLKTHGAGDEWLAMPPKHRPSGNRSRRLARHSTAGGLGRCFLRRRRPRRLQLGRCTPRR